MERYEVELIEQYDKLNLYSIRIDGHEYTEFEEFVLRFSDNDEYKEDLDIVLSWLDNIIRRGALERYFRPEYRYGSGISDKQDSSLLCQNFEQDSYFRKWRNKRR